MLISVSVSVLYVLAATALFIWASRAVRQMGSPQALTHFALVAPVVRMITAAMLVVAFLVLVSDNQTRRMFIIIFMACYLAMLVFDVWFFIRSQKKQ